MRIDSLNLRLRFRNKRLRLNRGRQFDRLRDRKHDERANLAEMTVCIRFAQRGTYIIGAIRAARVGVMMTGVMLGVMLVMANVANDIDAVVMMVLTLGQQRVQTVANERNAGVSRQHDITQKLAMLGPHGAEGASRLCAGGMRDSVILGLGHREGKG